MLKVLQPSCTMQHLMQQQMVDQWSKGVRHAQAIPASLQPSKFCLLHSAYL